MEDGIVKVQLEERIRFLLLKYPQSLERVAKEASDYVGAEVPISVVKKVLHKFKTKQDRDIKYWVACNLAQEILRQSMSRQAKLEDIYMRWEGKEEILVSTCCEFPVEKYEPLQSSAYYRCLKCNTTCNTALSKDLQLENLKLRLIKDMRTESVHLMKFAKDMGFVAGSESVPPKGDKNYIFVNQQQAQSPDGVPVETDLAQKAEDMSPMEVERLRLKLARLAEEATNTEFLEGNKEDVKSSDGQEGHDQ